MPGHFRRRFLAVALFLAANPAWAGDHLDTEHLFGFTEGSDIGAPPERELESETTARLGRRGGRYRAVDSALVLKLPLSDRFRIAPGLIVARYDIGGVPGLDDRQAVAVSGGFVEARARLLRRHEAPFGLTLNAVVGGNRVDPATGLGARGLTTEAALLIDREIVPGQLVAAVNLAYAIGHARLDGIADAQTNAGLEVSGALAGRLAPGLFLGAEARYLRAYQGPGLDRLAGEALHLGPSLYTDLPGDTWASLTWGVQVAGSAAGGAAGSAAGGAADTPDTRDLTNFDRYQARLRFGCHF